MEKLQAAIEKARTQRQTSVSKRKTGKSDEVPRAGVADSWVTLAPIEIAPHIARSNRLISYDGGADAGPFDMLRTRILQQAMVNDWKRIALVSPHSACGKTTTAANLIFSFGRQTDLHTMIFDLDLRRPGLANVLGLKGSQHSMSEVLLGTLPFASHGCRYGSNVALGLNHRSVRNASEILQSQNCSQVLDQIEADYAPDIMLFDMPPLMATDDNYGFLKNVDCALLLAEAEKTTVDQVDVAERQLAELTNVMGIVLNKSQFASDTYGYGYGYS